ncbi:MAG: exonuclease domain-containing protein [Candidatus Pacebacteria bacterium]|nr:exonuclease domain-containing protein [Candidatus Paceibacterota bacterium]
MKTYPERESNNISYYPPKTIARFVALDIETTGYSPAKNRIVEIGLVEVLVRLHGYTDGEETTTTVMTGTEYQGYFNPEVDYIHQSAIDVHGLTVDFLQDKPRFAEQIDPIAEFINGAQIIAHNASFDVGFLAAEFTRCGRELAYESAVCTLQIARDYWGVGGNGLGELCHRLRVPHDESQLHGAIYDARLAAQCWIKLNEKGARQYYARERTE